jgi:hypothetical protein
MSLLNIFERELQSGARGLRGMNVAGVVPLTQPLLNELLKNSGSAPRDVSLEIHAANKIVVHYGAFHVEAVLDDVMKLGTSPTISLTLASTVIAWTMKRTVNMPGLQIDGKRVTVDIGAVDALRGYRELWPHIKSVKLGTEPGVLTVVFEILIGDFP